MKLLLSLLISASALVASAYQLPEGEWEGMGYYKMPTGQIIRKRVENVSLTFQY